jgi:hypothetical protein
METQILIPDALRPPTSTKDLDISMMVVEDLFLRRTLLTDRTSTAKLSLDLGLDPRIIVSCFEQLKARKFLDVLKLEGNNYHFELTNLGRERAQASTDRCSYSDRAPVTLERYVEVVKLLKAEIQCSYADIQLAYKDLVMNRRTLDRIGPAFSAQQSIFFYGPSGTGKTSIAERLVRLYDDVVLVPVAVEVDGQIITVFDPTVHEPAGDLPQGYDPRFVLCKRPIVVTGGELELSMLQLKRDPISKVYSAPLQMKANNGIFLTLVGSWFRRAPCSTGGSFPLSVALTISRWIQERSSRFRLKCWCCSPRTLIRLDWVTTRFSVVSKTRSMWARPHSKSLIKSSTWPPSE